MDASGEQTLAITNNVLRLDMSLLLFITTSFVPLLRWFKFNSLHSIGLPTVYCAIGIWDVRPLWQLDVKYCIN